MRQDILRNAILEDVMGALPDIIEKHMTLNEFDGQWNRPSWQEEYSHYKKIFNKILSNGHKMFEEAQETMDMYGKFPKTKDKDLYIEGYGKWQLRLIMNSEEDVSDGYFDIYAYKVKYDYTARGEDDGWKATVIQILDKDLSGATVYRFESHCLNRFNLRYHDSDETMSREEVHDGIYITKEIIDELNNAHLKKGFSEKQTAKYPPESVGMHENVNGFVNSGLFVGFCNFTKTFYMFRTFVSRYDVGYGKGQMRPYLKTVWDREYKGWFIKE